ncbi:hypothetical protein ACFFK0_18755 [Paenibacillus chartarius]|uniref:Uncharacterized protein n=1 Tax=Paenibacillus chartarius TaxID=747481 RepID=A0ABV6DPA3_9BACL
MPNEDAVWKEEAEYFGVMSDAQELNLLAKEKMTNVPEDSVFRAPELQDEDE